MVEAVLFLVLDHEGNLNHDEEELLGFAVEVPKKELDLVSVLDFEDDPNGHHEDDFESWASAEFDEKTTRTKPSIAIRCAFMASLPY
jgi:hypothetical protein